MNAYKLLVGKPEGKRLLGRPRCRRVDNIRMDLGEVKWSDVNWIGLAQVQRSCEFGTELSGSKKCWETIDYHLVASPVVLSSIELVIQFIQFLIRQYFNIFTVILIQCY
jgi:hypothetical protein